MPGKIERPKSNPASMMRSLEQYLIAPAHYAPTEHLTVGIVTVVGA
jgi:hypothetical protein